MNKKKIEVPLGEYKIIAEVNDMNLPEIPEEICIYVTDKDGVFVQDLCVVSEHYEYHPEDGAFKHDSGRIDCHVWSDANSEDYTNKFIIPIREDE